MKPTIFMSLILATLVLFSTTDVSAALRVDSTPQTEDAQEELIKEIFQDANSVFNPPLTATDDLKRLEELQRLKAEVAEELKHLDRLRQLKVAIAEELNRLEALQRLKIKMTDDGHTDSDQKSFTPVGSWETVSIDGKPVTEHFLKTPTLDGKPLIEYLAERMQVPIGSDEGKSVAEVLGGVLVDTKTKISQNDFGFFENGSWFWTFKFNIEVDIGGGLALVPTVGLAAKGSYFTPRGGTIVMVQEGLQIQLEPEDLWTSAGITEEDFKKEITSNWLFGKAEGKIENWEASPNGNTLTLTNANGITQVLRRKGSGSKYTWVPAEEQEKLTEMLTEALSRVEAPEKRNSFDGIYKREGFVRTGTDYALLFATDTYEHWVNLSTSIADAEAIGAELADRYGFQVDIRKNLKTRADILNTLAEYAQKDYQPGDQLFVYFAGHGNFSEELKDGHIATSDSKLPTDDPSHTTYLAYAQLRQYLDGIACARVMLVLDVCYGGTFDDNIALIKALPTVIAAPPTRGISPPILDLNQTLKVKTRWYLSASGKEETSEGPEHSPFALSLLTVLRNGAGADGVLTIPEIERLLPTKLREELDKLAAAWKEKHPLWEGKIQQTPASGPFGSGKAADKAFVFIGKDFVPLPSR